MFEATSERAWQIEGVRIPSLLADAVLVTSASLFVALCSRVAVPLYFTPVPITLQTFAVLLAGLCLGPRRGAAALALYLAEGAAGLPVFSPMGPGGMVQLLGPTGGFLMAYPAVAWSAGFVSRAGKGSASAAITGCVIAEAILFALGGTWLAAVTHIGPSKALTMAVLPFLPGDALKTAAAVSVAMILRRFRRA